MTLWYWCSTDRRCLPQTYDAHQYDLQSLPLDVVLCEGSLDGLNSGALKQRHILELFQLLCGHMFGLFQGVLTGANQHDLIILVGCHLQ